MRDLRRNRAQSRQRVLDARRVAGDQDDPRTLRRQRPSRCLTWRR
jgi:hypothetical protein